MKNPMIVMFESYLKNLRKVAMSDIYNEFNSLSDDEKNVYLKIAFIFKKMFDDLEFKSVFDDLEV